MRRSGVTTTTTWVYDGLTLMSQQVVSGSSSWRIDYLYNEEGTPIGGVYRSPATSTSPAFFAIVTNSHGDVCELLDANGNAFATYHYDAWGLPQWAGSYATGIWTSSTSLISSTLAGQIAGEQALRYAGYVYDPESGLYYCSARYYDPATRQWTTADSAKADGEESAYQYCSGDPVSHRDITGLGSTTTSGTERCAGSDGSYIADMFATVYYKSHSSSMWQVTEVDYIIENNWNVGEDGGSDDSWNNVMEFGVWDNDTGNRVWHYKKTEVWGSCAYTAKPSSPVYTHKFVTQVVKPGQSPQCYSYVRYKWTPEGGSPKIVVSNWF